MSTSSLFKWRHFLPELSCSMSGLCCRYSLSYHDLEEMMLERSVEIDHSTINHWVLKYVTELDKPIRPHLKLTNDSWRAAYPKAIDELKADKELPQKVKLRQKKYLNNIVEQDHRQIKRLVKPGMGFGSFNTARRTIKGYEIMNMMRKGQIQGVDKGAVIERLKFINQIFGVAA